MIGGEVSNGLCSVARPFAGNGGGTATTSGTRRKAAVGVYRLTLTARDNYGTATQAFHPDRDRCPGHSEDPGVKTRVGSVLRLTAAPREMVPAGEVARGENRFALFKS